MILTMTAITAMLLFGGDISGAAQRAVSPIKVDVVGVDPAGIALALWNRPADTRRRVTKEDLQGDYRPDFELVNEFGVHSKGFDAAFSTAQQSIGTTKTVLSADRVVPDVSLAHILSTAAGRSQRIFTFVIVLRNSAWKIRSASVTLVQPPPPEK
jgi:hypothetical protein